MQSSTGLEIAWRFLINRCLDGEIDYFLFVFVVVVAVDAIFCPVLLLLSRFRSFGTPILREALVELLYETPTLALALYKELTCS